MCIFAWLKTPLEECIKRNTARTVRQVPHDSMIKISQNFEPPGLLYFERNLVEINDTSLFCDLIKFEEIALIKQQETFQTEQGLNHQIDQVIRAKIGTMMKLAPRKWAEKLA